MNRATERIARSGKERTAHGPARVSARALSLGLVLAAFMAWLNCWVETLFNVHFLGGIQMPFGAVFVLLFLVLFFNAPLRWLHRAMPASRRAVPSFSAAELLVIYSMTLFATLLSTAGTDNFFLTVGPALFYYASRENGWAELFYSHIPRHFAPGWDGTTYQREIIEPLYLGGLTFDQIPWHAWAAMLIAWSVFLLLIYATLFFLSLLLRRQWIENEALSFPLLQLPFSMVEIESGQTPPSGVFWRDKGMWMGFAIAAFFHGLRGLNAYYPDWPNPPLGLQFNFTELPWNAAGTVGAEWYFGAVGIAYLLTREVSFSFWFFFLLFKFQLVAATVSGFPAPSLPKDSYMGNPTFLTFQSAGGWIAMAALLLWPIRSHVAALTRESLGIIKPLPTEDTPFGARFVLGGLLLSLAGVFGWSLFAGISWWVALPFFAIYLVASVVIGRLVVEGGLLFPQMTFSATEWMTTTLFGASTIGAANLTKLAFLQPMLMSDMRTNLLPGFLHTFKIAHDLKLESRDVRRLTGGVTAAIVVALCVTVATSLAALYSKGGLAGYAWFASLGPQSVLNGAASAINGNQSFDWVSASWMGAGAGAVWMMALMRARFLWFPLHPLGFLVAGGYPMQRLWFSFFAGWIIKTLMLRFSGSDGMTKLRPFMIGLILGNLCAMMFWMLLGFRSGQQIPYWPA